MPTQMLNCTHSTWASSKPPTLPLSRGQTYKSPIYLPMLRQHLRQEPTRMDISQWWRWRRTISNSWACRDSPRVVLRSSLFTVCFPLLDSSFPFIWTWAFFGIVSFMQPTPQSFGNFPTTHGKTASFFLDQGVQLEFAFIPDDGSATHVINVDVSFLLSLLWIWCKLQLCYHSRTPPRHLLVPLKKILSLHTVLRQTLWFNWLQAVR